jgi:hypothetical protein
MSLAAIGLAFPVRTDLSGDLHFIAQFSDFANMETRFFNFVPEQRPRHSTGAPKNEAAFT